MDTDKFGMDSDDEYAEMDMKTPSDNSPDSDFSIECEIACKDEEENCTTTDPTRVPNSQRKTPNLMTKYERARILGTRALQLANGAASTIGYENCGDTLELAEKELLSGQIPFIVRREVENGKYELWKVSELTPKDL